MFRLAPVTTLVLFWPVADFAQDPVIRIDVNLVQVDAVVTDSSNKHIPDLKAEDFEVLQDGKLQRITNLSYIAPSLAPPSTLPSTTSGGNLMPPPPHSLLKAGTVRRMLALVVDDLGLSFENIAHVWDALRRFVNRDMQPGDLVAIVRTSAGMGALQQFTNDPRILNAAIDHIKFPFGRIAESSFAPAIAFSDPVEKKLAAINQSADEFRSGMFMAGTLGALRYVIEGLRDMPGRKAVVLFSESMALAESSLRSLSDAANRASVVVHTIDPRGLQTFYDVRDTDASPQVQTQREADMFESQQGLAGLAEATGGRFIKNANRVDEALQEVVQDSEGYYLIGYRPDSATFDSKDGKISYHRIQVRVLIAGLRIRSREGFFGDPDAAYGAAAQGQGTLLRALTSPFSSGDIRVQLTTLFDQTPERRSNLSALLHIDADDVKFAVQPDGLRKASIEVVAMTFNADGKASGRTDRIFNLALDPAQYAAALSKGMVYVMNQPVQMPGAYQMRVALRDQVSERIGSANEFIEVPDLTKKHLTLSSLMLRRDARQGTWAPTEGKAADNDPVSAAAFRVFQPGDLLYYEYFVFNAQTGKSDTADLEVQTRLFHEGNLVYTGRPMLPSVAGEASSGRLLAGGHLTLGHKFPPGNYVLQVIVTDKLAKEKYRTTSQAIDFAVTSN